MGDVTAEVMSAFLSCGVVVFCLDFCFLLVFCFCVFLGLLTGLLFRSNCLVRFVLVGERVRRFVLGRIGSFAVVGK